MGGLDKVGFQVRVQGIRFVVLLVVFCLVWLVSLGGCKKQENLSENTVKVVRALDGDTVLLHNGERLRYAGIDTPELNHGKGLPPQPFAEEAYRLNKRLTEGKVFRLKASLKEKDHYGRLLGDLYFENGTSVSEILVREGLALVCYFPGSADYYHKLLPLQAEVVKKRKGFFSLLDKQPKGVVYIGNKQSKRFHHPDCTEAKRIKRKVYFKSLEEAFLEGYCPSRECFDKIFPGY
ncbi:nuclease [Thermodesulfobacterium sp. TA1]|uniref:thermonuclease family protein n=1 Tax=Thermodesulfobacterium sp. TA1 TaxID=2234087 RepID=UPI0012327FDD|nr:thermonuclease family protein [Thermodesulfobacterium sp. TA1]QER42448.1 nuclease [Thermodesulfobacterium sp. TA1]